MADIKDIHNNVFDYLLDKYPTLRFQLRSRQGDRLKNDYWFHGNDNYLTVSFWTGWDFNNNTPNIYLNIDTQEKCTLFLTDIQGGKKADFFKKIAPSLKLEQVKGQKKERFVWYKTVQEGDYLTALDTFIQNDKLLIDSFIGIGNIGIDPVDEADFLKKRDKILALRHIKIEQKTESDAPLSIQRLKLENIGHFSELDIDLSKRVTCFIGENGSGKSTILRTIILGLTNVNDEDADSLVQSTHPKLQNLLKIEGEKGVKTVLSENGCIQLDYSIQGESYKNILNFSGETEQRLDKSTNLPFDYHPITADIESDNAATENGNLLKNLVIGFSQIKNVAQNKNGQQTISETRANISDALPLLYETADHSFENVQRWILSAFDPSVKESDRAKTKLVIEKAFGIISQITGSQIELINADHSEIFVRTIDSPNGIPLRLLSQGFSNVIGWVGHFMKRLSEVTLEGDFIQTPAICLIDELDTYLHPKWQRTILNVLATTFSNTCFIITTHSPLIISNLPSDDTRIYTIGKNANGEMTAFENTRFKPYGATAERVLDLMMDLDERPEAVEKIFKDFFRAIQNNDFDTADSIAQNLEILIDKGDPDLLRGKTQIETRRKLKQLQK